jgi:3-deoxy-manno-octulosonate cytidylyltransferase (CMP-KDO synthetase)
VSYTIIIPARLDSSRLAQKALADLGGKPLIVRVLEQAHKTAAKRIIAATDAPRIADAVAAAGFEAILTKEAVSGSDRVAMAAKMMHIPDQEIVVNIQGDEPFFEPASIDRLARQLQNHTDVDMATQATAMTEHDAENPNAVKVVMTHDCKALYFSRAKIPFMRAGKDTIPPAPLYYRHIGIYAFYGNTLQRYITLAASPLEQTESLEQLRALQSGWKILVVLVKGPHVPGIDTPEDLERARLCWTKNQEHSLGDTPS